MGRLRAHAGDTHTHMLPVLIAGRCHHHPHGRREARPLLRDGSDLPAGSCQSRVCHDFQGKGTSGSMRLLQLSWPRGVRSQLESGGKGFSHGCDKVWTSSKHCCPWNPVVSQVRYFFSQRQKKNDFLLVHVSLVNVRRRKGYVG